MFIRDRNEGSVYDYVPGAGLRLIQSAGDPQFVNLRIKDVDRSVFQYVSRTIDGKFVNEPVVRPKCGCLAEIPFNGGER